MSAKQFPKGPTVTLVRTIRPKGLPSVYCNNSCCIYSRECVVTSFYSSIVRLVGSHYLSDRSPKPPSLSSPRWWLHLHTRTSSTVVKTFGVNIQEEIVGGEGGPGIRWYIFSCPIPPPLLKIIESNLFPVDQARLKNVFFYVQLLFRKNVLNPFFLKYLVAPFFISTVSSSLET